MKTFLLIFFIIKTRPLFAHIQAIKDCILIAGPDTYYHLSPQLTIHVLSAHKCSKEADVLQKWKYTHNSVTFTFACQPHLLDVLP